MGISVKIARLLMSRSLPFRRLSMAVSADAVTRAPIL
jgi:hypothetical protein